MEKPFCRNRWPHDPAHPEDACTRPRPELDSDVLHPEHHCTRPDSHEGWCRCACGASDRELLEEPADVEESQ